MHKNFDEEKLLKLVTKYNVPSPYYLPFKLTELRAKSMMKKQEFDKINSILLRAGIKPAKDVDIFPINILLEMDITPDSWYAIYTNFDELQSFFIVSMNQFEKYSYEDLEKYNNPSFNNNLLKRNFTMVNMRYHNHYTLTHIGEIFSRTGTAVNLVVQKYGRLFKRWLFRKNRTMLDYLNTLLTQKSESNFFQNLIKDECYDRYDMRDIKILLSEYLIEKNNGLKEIPINPIRYSEIGSKIIERSEGEIMRFSFDYTYYDLYE